MNNSKNNYHILIISNGFPNYYNALDGIFYYDQALALKKNFPNAKIGFISVNPIGLRDFIKKPNLFKLGMNKYNRFGVNIYQFCYINIPIIPNFDIKIANFLYPKLFKGYIKKFGLPQIIHVHAFEAGLAAILIKQKYHIPFLITEHSSKFLNNKLSEVQQAIAKQVFSESALNIAVSSDFAKKLSVRFKLPFITIANLVKMDEFGPMHAESKVYDLINIGAFNDNKNQILILKSLAKYKFGKVLLVGEGPNENKLKTYVKENQLEHFVDFMPFKSRQELFSLIKKAHCLAVTSNHETFGVVAIEAMACGVPVISTRAGGPNDIVIENVNGYFMENNEDSFYEAFCKIKENLSKFAAHKLVEYTNQHFSENAIANKLLESYKNIIRLHG